MSHASIGLDVTPMSSGHAVRGIGRYISGLLSALLTHEAEWCRENLGLVLAQDQMRPEGIAASWRTYRSRLRSQDTGWFVAGLSDRLATRDAERVLWHETDPLLPFGISTPDRAVITVYDLIPMLQRTSDRIHRRSLYRLYAHRLRRARAIIAISKTTARDVCTILQVDPERISVIYPPVAPVGATPPLGSAGDGPRPLLFVGVPAMHKRADLAIRVLAGYRAYRPEATLTFVGHHPPQARGQLRELAGSLDVSSAVQFHDFVDDVDLGALYARGTLLALSTREGFGLPPVECLLSGGRVVAVPRPVYNEVLGAAASFAADESVPALVEAVLEAERRAVPEAAIGAFAEQYSPRAVAAALVRTYRRLTET